MQHGEQMGMQSPGRTSRWIWGGMKMEMGKPVIPAGPMKVTFGDKAAEKTPAMLAALPHKAIKLWNEHAKACQAYSGVPLIDLLKPLGVPEKPHGKELRLYVIAEGADAGDVQALPLPDAKLRRGHHRFRHPQRDPHRPGAGRSPGGVPQWCRFPRLGFQRSARPRFPLRKFLRRCWLERSWRVTARPIAIWWRASAASHPRGNSPS